MSTSKSVATDKGAVSRHVCTRKSAACAQGVCICRPLPTNGADAPMSVVEYLSIAIQAASRLKTQNIPLSVDQAKQLLAEVEAARLGELAQPSTNTPPPLTVTTLTPSEVALRVSPSRPGYVGIWKKAKDVTVARPQTLTATEAERRYLKPVTRNGR